MLKPIFLTCEAALDRIFGARWNPLYQLGALGFFYYWIVAVSGIYIYIFFDTGTTEAYQSVEYMTQEQWYLAGVMRSLHRYGSDAMVLMMVVHILREFAYGRFRGPRWFTWVTGIPIAGLIIVSGITGYWLVWDELAQYIALISSEWFDWLAIFGQSIARNFLTPQALDDRFFTLLIFIHIAVPLIALLGLWIHLLRISRPQINPNRGLAAGTFIMILALCFIYPATSHPPADLTHALGTLRLDWYYLAAYPLMDLLGYGTVWVLLLTVSTILIALPWLPPKWKAEAAAVHLEACNGCGRCADDCPYEAILMLPRSDELPFESEAAVNAANCTACGICAGACPPATPFRRLGELIPGIELPQKSIADLRQRVIDASNSLQSHPRVIVFGCDHALGKKHLPNADCAFVSQPCIAGFPPSFFDFALSRNLAEGIVITGCRPGCCQYRSGPEWTEGRIAGTRDPYLRRRVPRERLKIIWASLSEEKYLNEKIREFRRELGTLDNPEGTEMRPAPRPTTQKEEEFEKP